MNKRYIILPALLLIYLAIVAYFTYPGRHPEAEGVGYTQYFITIAVVIAILGALSFFLKKKGDNRRKNKDKK